MNPGHRHHTVILLLLFCSLLAGCSLLRRKHKEKPGPVGQATLIGMIEMVNPEQNYVVIRCDTPPAIQPGTELVALSASGTRSKLVLSPERKGYYLTADIKEGSPSVANLVLLPLAAPPAATAPVPPPAQPAPAGPSASDSTIPGMAAAVPSTPLQNLQPAESRPPALPPSAGAESQPPPRLDDLEPPIGNP